MKSAKQTPFTLGYIKKRILMTLGQYFNEDGGAVYNGSRKAQLEGGISSAIYSALVEVYEVLYASKGLSAPFIDENTSDDFETELDELALEAVVCLAASKLCTEDEASTYTRLLYKYKDLCEGAFEVKTSQKTRNGFYGTNKKRGIN